jgi:prepilin-type N-terminal cleavage/methylation domain-containing protein
MSQFICIGKKNKRFTPTPQQTQMVWGFTIIELLVVIAIVGILAAIVLVRTGSARKEGEDIAVRTTLREIRNTGELYYNNNETYEGICDPSNTTLSDDGDFKRIKDHITKYNGSEGIIGCKDDEAGYAVISSLNLGNCWCIDSEGAGREVELTASDCREELRIITCP